MTKLGTRTGKILYTLLLGSLACVAVIAVVCFVGLAWTSFNSQTIWADPLTVHYANNMVVNWPNSMEIRNTVYLVQLGMCGLLAMVIVPLIGIMRSATDGHPFIAANIARLHWIATAFALVAIGRLILPFTLPGAAASIFGFEKPDISFGPIMMVMVILVLAEVFREGVRLHDDVQATI